MVKDSRAQVRLGTLRLLNRPEPREVQEGDEGDPERVLLRHRWVVVAAIEDRWRIDDEWWRGSPLSRMYYQLTLENGRRLTLFHDMGKSRWYEQRYV